MTCVGGNPLRVTERMATLLENKTAILYGGGGHVGAAVARAFAREGARVVLTGRTAATLDAVASQIDVDGGRLETAQVDATDPHQVEAHFASVVDRTGGVDVSFNMWASPKCKARRWST